MLNFHTPFPRYENAIFVGDTATEALAALRIYAKALVGGDIPSMELLHPTEKMIECTRCAMHDRPKILDSAARRIGADYILLEENGLSELNPATMEEPLREAGFTVRVLDVRCGALEAVDRAAAMFGEERQAERVREDYNTRIKNVQGKPQFKNSRILVLLGIRHPVETVKDSVFAVTERADLSSDILTALRCRNAVSGRPYLEPMPGLLPVSTECLAELILKTDPDAIALTGDSSAAMGAVLQSMREFPIIQRSRVFLDNRFLPLPWFCRPMGWRLPRILETWQETLIKAVF